MTRNQSCPEPARWLQLLQNVLSAEEQEELQTHLEGCERCQQGLEQLAAESGSWADVAEHLGRGLPEPITDPALEQALGKLQEQLPEAVGPSRTEPEPPEGGVPNKGLDDVRPLLGPPDQPGQLGRLDHYQVLEVVGRGGMGVVLKARDTALQRVVAVKLLAPHLAASAVARQRFIREAQAAAAVRDDHVVSIHAVSQGPVPYLVMEYVPGVTLEQRLGQEGVLELKEVLRIGMQMARGLAAAHKQGLIHRDVKPANVLLENGVQRVKLTDFGLARAIHDSSLTQSGVIAGTPDYMAPEQARGDALDHRSDLFSLGSVLYALCTGHPPFRAASPLAVLKRVTEETPPPIWESNPEVSDCLVGVIDRLLAKDPTQRFQSAAEVAEVLSQALAQVQRGQGVLSPTLPMVKARQPAGAHPGAAGLPAPALHKAAGKGGWLPWALAGALLAMAALVLIGWPRAGNPSGSGEEARQGTLPAAAAQARLPNPLAGRKQPDIPPVLLALAGGGEPQRAPPELVAVLGDDRFRRIGQICGVAWSPDGKRLATCAGTFDPQQGLIHCSTTIWSVPDGRLLHTLEGHTEAVLAVAFSPDGQRLATVSGDHTTKVWEVETGKELFTLQEHTDHVRCVAFSPDGKLLATGSDDHNVILWDAATGKRQRTFANHTGMVLHVTFRADGARVASSASFGDGHVRIWETATGQEVLCLKSNNEALRGAAFSPDGKRLVSVSDAAASPVWDAATGMELFQLQGHTSWVLAAAWTPDGKQIVTSSHDRSVRIWDAESGRELRQCPGVYGVPMSLALRSDGKQVAAGLEDGTIHFWSVPDGRLLGAESSHHGPVRGVAVSPDGQLLASAGQDHVVKLWDLAGWKAGQALPPVRTLRRHTAVVWSLAFSPDGKQLASASADNTIALWDVATGQEVRSLAGQSKGESVLAFSPDGRSLAAGQEDGQIKVWDAATGQAREPVRGPAFWVRAVAFSPDGRLLASAGATDGTVQVAEVASGRRLHTFRPGGLPLSVAFSPDGKTVAAGTSLPDAALHRWDLESGREWPVARGHTGHVSSLAFQPGGEVLATGSHDGTVRLWTPTAEGLRSQVIGPGPFGKTVSQVAFTPDGRYLVTANENGTVSVLAVPVP